MGKIPEKMWREKNDKWQIQYAGWRYLRRNELFLESLSILEKIFPNL